MAENSLWLRTKRAVREFDPVVGLLIGALILLYAPILTGVQTLFWGLPILQFFPWHEAAKQMALSGFPPLWNPALGMGAPLLANAQSAVLYPPNWLLLFIPVDYGQGLLMVAHLLWAGIGMVLLIRRLGIGRLGQAVGGLAFMLSGYLAARAWFLTINASVAWLPWIILAGENAGAQKRGVVSLPLAFALCLQWLAGHWQTAWYTGLILAGWMAVRAFGARPFWKQVLLSGARLAGAGLLAAMLGAAQFLPTIGYWLHSQRSAGVDPQAALAYSFWPWRLLTLIAPDFFGNPARGDYWGYANYWEDAIYIGLLPLGLAVWAGVRALRRKGLAGFPYGYLLVLLPLTLILGLGTNTPVFTFLFDHIPTFNFFQAPTRIMIGFVFALCLLAAAGAEHWALSSPGSGDWTARFAVAAAGVTLAGIGASFLAYIKPSFSGSIIIVGVIGLGIAGLGFLKIACQRRPLAARIFPAAAAGLIALDLIFAARGLVPAASPELYRAENPAAADTLAGLKGRRIYMPEEIRYRLMYDRAFVFRTFEGLPDWMEIRRWELPNAAGLDGISSANNFDSFVFERYAELLKGIESLPAAQRDRLLQMMNVGGVWEWPEGTDAPALRFLTGDSAPAWGVCRAEWMISPEDAWQAVMDPFFDPARTVVLELGSGVEGADCESPPVIAVQAGRDPNTVRIEVDFPGAGYLVLPEMNDHGWEAFLDGERVPVLRADYVFRAVRVPAGKHIVEFSYRPLAFTLGAMLSGVVILVLLAAVILHWVGRARRREPLPSHAERTG